MRRRTWAAVVATAALAAAPVASAAAGGTPTVRELEADDWVVRGGDDLQAFLQLDLEDDYTSDVVVLVDDVVAEHTIVPVDGGFAGGIALPEDVRCGAGVVVEAEVRWTYEGKYLYSEDFRTEVHVLCPELSVTPDRLPATSPGTPLTWQVTGFVPDSVVALRFGDQPVQVVETDQAGEARYVAPAPQVACGVVPARAIDRSGPEERKEREIPTQLVVEALDRVRVDCPDRPQPEPAVVPAVVQVNPAVVNAGTTTRVTGQQFPPGSPVALTWVLPGGRTLPAGTATADAAGSVRVDLLVMANSGTGTRQLLAGSGAAVASDQLLVVGGTTQPGRQGLVNRR